MSNIKLLKIIQNILFSIYSILTVIILIFLTSNYIVRDKLTNVLLTPFFPISFVFILLFTAISKKRQRKTQVIMILLSYILMAFMFYLYYDACFIAY